MVIALVQKGWQFDLVRVVAFLVTFACGTAIAYSFMLLLTSLSVWMVRNQSLMEMWWLFSSLARYPKEIFAGTWAEPLGNFFTFIVPILLVANVPANVMVRVFDPWMVALTLVAATCSCSTSAAGSSSTRCGRIAARVVEASEDRNDPRSTATIRGSLAGCPSSVTGSRSEAAGGWPASARCFLRGSRPGSIVSRWRKIVNSQ